MRTQLYGTTRLDPIALTSTPPKRVVDVIRRLRGGSQAKLVRGDDGFLYILKCFPNPQGPNILANEWIGSIILNGLGIQCGTPSRLLLEKSIIATFPLLTLDYGDRWEGPRSGIHFASQLAGDESGQHRPQDLKPPNVERLSINRLDYLKVRLIDLWANMQDIRQYVVVPTGLERTVTAYFIDHGHMFGGPSWEATDDSKCSRLSSLQMLGGIGWEAEIVRKCIDDMERRIPALLSVALTTLPSDWYQGNLKSFENTQLRRLRDFRSRTPC